MGGREEGRVIVEAYLKHVAEHAVAEALTCLAPGFTLEFAGTGFALDKRQAATALEWDAGVGGRLEWAVVAEASPAVTLKGFEVNEFLDLIGIGRLPFRSVFEVGPEGLITRQIHEVDWGERTLQEAMRPLVEWAADHEPEELAEIHPDGQMIYTRDMGRRWVSLARRWRADVAGRT